MSHDSVKEKNNADTRYNQSEIPNFYTKNSGFHSCFTA
jgi:hypothetical protein